MQKNNKVLVSVISPSIRKGALDIVAKCLKTQFFTNWEWVVSTPYKAPFPAIQAGVTPKGNFFYALNRDLNRCFRKAKGKLIVIILDGVWFPPDLLDNMVAHYENNPKALVTAVGNQYEFVNGQPTAMVWKDPRIRMDQGSFYRVDYPEMEFCIVSIPRQAILDCCGLKEAWDLYSASSEKELCARIEKFGYSLYIDQSIEYKNSHHERLYGESEWDKHYFEGCKYMEYCMGQVNQGKELLGNL